MRRTALTAVSLALILLAPAGCQFSTPAPYVAPDRAVVVGAWNVEWLGMPDRRSGPADGVAQEAEAIADYIDAADVDVLALQEIASDMPDGTPRNRTLNAALTILSRRNGSDWRHVVYPSRSGRDQNCAIAWNAGEVTMLSDPFGFEVPVGERQSEQGSTVWSRPPRAALFTAGDALTDFVVVPVHHKSNYGGDFAEHRAEEARALVAGIEVAQEALADTDVLIIGDFNTQSAEEPSLAVYRDAGFVDLNDADASTYWRGAPLDRALVPAGEPEFASRRFEVFYEPFAGPRGLTDEDFKRAYSDHRMVITRVRVMRDDD